MQRHKVVIEIMIEGASKNEALASAQQLCDVINSKNKHYKAWIPRMVVDSKEEVKTSKIPNEKDLF